jgi:MCP family monocarboxylic acid transporter-like MFS transporter 9
MIPVAYTTFNAYFVEKRVLMMIQCQTLIGIGAVIFPLAFQQLMEIYGFRGCMAILAAVNSHTILGMLVMHPVEWHMKKVEIMEEHEMEIVPCEIFL